MTVALVEELLSSNAKDPEVNNSMSFFVFRTKNWILLRGSRTVSRFCVLLLDVLIRQSYWARKILDLEFKLLSFKTLAAY